MAATVALLVLSVVVVAVSGQVWIPAPGTSWQWQLEGVINTTVPVDVYDIDLFGATDADIAALKSAGKKVVCYFSAGTYENWRSDEGCFPRCVLGSPLQQWAGERWIDVTSPLVHVIMASRLDLAVQRGCDAVEPDNVDGYSNNNGLNLSYSEQLDYNLWLAQEAHLRNLSIGLKNAVDMIVDLAPEFDWALNEECLTYNECYKYLPFRDAGKAVFHVEYVETTSQGEAKQASVCGNSSRPSSFSTLIKEWDVRALVHGVLGPCPGP